MTCRRTTDTEQTKSTDAQVCEKTVIPNHCDEELHGKEGEGRGGEVRGEGAEGEERLELKVEHVTHRQRLTEEESSLYSCVIGKLKDYFDTVWIVRRRLWWKTFRLPLLLLLQRLE